MERVSRLPRRVTSLCQLGAFLLILSVCGCGAKSAPDVAMNSDASDGGSDSMQPAAVPTEAIVVHPEAMSVPPAAMSVPPEAMAIPPRAMQARSVASASQVAAAPQFRNQSEVLVEPQVPAASMAASASDVRVAPQASTFPAGTQTKPDDGFATVQVFYATDRQRGSLPLSAIEVTGQQQSFLLLCGCAILLLAVASVQGLRGRTPSSATAAVLAGVTGCGALALLVSGHTNIEKHGVTYSVERGTLARGICEVTVPNSHQRGQVERPSLLRFEIREDQQKHIVLTSATELSSTDFQQRLSTTVASSPSRDLLVFIHGYNVNFESAVQRTAQIAVDLPFEGVPVCYSWPSQGSLIGYPVDENNVEWTVTHLKEVLLELANESGAESINVVAHSMGNRAMTAALQQLQWQRPADAAPLFDRVVLAAPDVDADRFRRDLAPALVGIANQVTLYASSDDQALQASKQVHGYPRAGDGGANIVIVPGVETIDVSGIDLSLLGHSYYGDNESMLRELYEVIRARLPATERNQLVTRQFGQAVYWQLAQRPGTAAPELR